MEKKSISRILKFDNVIFSKDSILKASYKYSNIFYFSDIRENENKIMLELILKDSTQDIEKSILDFKNEIIDQEVRYKIHNETKSIKEEIVKRAFSSIS